MPRTTRGRWTKRRITLEGLDGPGTPEVLGDESRLRQVLRNRCKCRLAHPEAPTSPRESAPGDDHPRVADDGPGMKSGDALRVNRQFYRDSSRARASGGTGLGLSIVDSLVAAAERSPA